jgi:predicted amidohydrolase
VTGERGLPATETGEENTVRIACAQLAARDIDQHERALGEALDAVAEAGRVGADLVLLPECTYPAYVLATDATPRGMRSDDDVVALFEDAARTHGLFVAVGLARGWRPDERVGWNHAVLVGPDGRVHLESDKHLLWDFDRHWFRPGEPSEARTVRLTPDVSTAVGMLICADLRMPEVARTLAVTGARLLLDPTAWVTAGDPAVTSNPQPEYLMSVRAVENGVWIAAADKVGMERGTVVYAGRSTIMAPDGTIAALASASEPEVIWADVDLRLATGPPVSRRPELYEPLVDTRVGSPTTRRDQEPLIPREASLRVGLLQSGAEDLAAAEGGAIAAKVPLIDALGISVLALAARGTDDDLAWLCRWLEGETGVATAVAGVDPDGDVSRLEVVYRSVCVEAEPTHRRTGRASGSLDHRTLDVGVLRLAAMVGSEGLVPEIARMFAVAGVDLVIWAAGITTPMPLSIARARAMENRVWVALVQPTGAQPVDDGASGRVALIDPDGRPVAMGFPGREHLVAGVVNVFASRAKQVTPGTDVLADRQPASYSRLTASTGWRQ